MISYYNHPKKLTLQKDTLRFPSCLVALAEINSVWAGCCLCLVSGCVARVCTSGSARPGTTNPIRPFSIGRTRRRRSSQLATKTRAP